LAARHELRDECPLICRVIRVTRLELHVTGLDAIDRTPVLDIKPWVTQFGPRGEVHQPCGWTS